MVVKMQSDIMLPAYNNFFQYKLSANISVIGYYWLISYTVSKTNIDSGLLYLIWYLNPETIWRINLIALQRDRAQMLVSDGCWLLCHVLAYGAQYLLMYDVQTLLKPKPWQKEQTNTTMFMKYM